MTGYFNELYQETQRRSFVALKHTAVILWYTSRELALAGECPWVLSLGESGQLPLELHLPPVKGRQLRKSMEDRPSQRNQAGRLVLASWVLWLSGRRARLPQGFLNDSWPLVSFSKDGLFSWKMKLAVWPQASDSGKPSGLGFCIYKLEEIISILHSSLGGGGSWGGRNCKD